jgi:hypothetical protein
MDRVHARARANAVARDGLAWVKTKTVYDVEDLHGEHVHEMATWRMWAKTNTTWQQLTSKNGKPKNGKPEPPDANLAAGLITWFTYRLDAIPIQPEPGTGIPCWVVHFSPSGQGKPDGLMEEVASRMKGTMYIDENGFWIRSAAGELAEPYQKKFLGVPVGTAQKVNFTLGQREALGAVITHRLSVTFTYSTILGARSERHQYAYTDFSFNVPAPAP